MSTQQPDYRVLSHREAQRKYYRTHREKELARTRAYRAAIKAKLRKGGIKE